LGGEAKRDFIEFLIGAGALQFGEFTLKSGRVSPYFFNVGRFQTGSQIARLGEFMAAGVLAAAPKATLVFGPAYKGIPLCVATAIALSRARGGRDAGYLFDRKEAKTHGDAGRFVGHLPGPADHIVLVDDVITDGATKLEAVAMLRETFSAPIDALVIAFNRMERDAQGRDALAEFTRATGVPVHALLSLAELQAALDEGLPGLQGGPGGAELARRVRDYRARYGVA
jgi:orotate phosphoribosyltransferase